MHVCVTHVYMVIWSVVCGLAWFWQDFLGVLDRHAGVLCVFVLDGFLSLCVCARFCLLISMQTYIFLRMRVCLFLICLRWILLCMYKTPPVYFYSGTSPGEVRSMIWYGIKLPKFWSAEESPISDVHRKVLYWWVAMMAFSGASNGCKIIQGLVILYVFFFLYTCVLFDLFLCIR